MNRGEIPGFYYDPEKKKYFKVQANHIAPANAKYNKTNAKIDRANKKRKLEQEQHQEIARKETVVTAKSLKHPLLAGAGLRREIGHKPYLYHHVQRDTAFVQGLVGNESQLRLEGFDKRHTVFTDAHYIPEHSSMLLAVRHDVGSHAVYAYNCQGDWKSDQPLPSQRALHAFHEPVTTLQHFSSQGEPFFVTTTAQPNKFSGNFFLGPVEEDHRHGIYGHLTLNIGGEGDIMWDCKVDPSHRLIACAGSFGVQIFDILAGIRNQTNLKMCGHGHIFAADWLNPHTLALGAKHYDTYHDVFLYDVRSEGMSQRVHRVDKINGIFRPDDTGHNVVVASSHDVSLYDLRNLSKDTPVITLNHKSGSPYVHVSILNGNLVAATDWNNKLQIYSLRSGNHLRTLAPCKKRNGLVWRPRWQEDHRGVPYLQACVEDSIQRWS